MRTAKVPMKYIHKRADVKLRLIIKSMDEILNFMFTPGMVDDRKPLKREMVSEERERTNSVRTKGVYSNRKLWFSGLHTDD